MSVACRASSCFAAARSVAAARACCLAASASRLDAAA
jgi:hypothetical protein